MSKGSGGKSAMDHLQSLVALQAQLQSLRSSMPNFLTPLITDPNPAAAEEFKQKATRVQSEVQSLIRNLNATLDVLEEAEKIPPEDRELDVERIDMNLEEQILPVTPEPVVRAPPLLGEGALIGGAEMGREVDDVGELGALLQTPRASIQSPPGQHDLALGHENGTVVNGAKSLTNGASKASSIAAREETNGNGVGEEIDGDATPRTNGTDTLFGGANGNGAFDWNAPGSANLTPKSD